MTTKPNTPEGRAEDAVAALLAREEPITAAAVRKEAGTSMAVALDAVRAWKRRDDEREEDDDAGEVPREVAALHRAAWVEAVKVARAAYDDERAAFGRTLADLRDQVATAQAERDEAATEVDRLAAEVEQLTAKLTELTEPKPARRRTTAKAEG